jgi:NADH-ubiquinone oxidoreductase chain 5
MAAPTPISALVHSSTLITAGVIILFRLYPFLTSSTFLFISLLFRLFTLIYSCVSGLLCMDLKRTVALSTLSNVAILMFRLSCGFLDLAFLHLVLHAFFKSILFLVVGFILHSCFGSQDSRLPSSFSHLRISLLIIPVRCLAALSFTAAYFSKDVLIEAFISTSSAIITVICFIIIVILSVCYAFRLILHVLSIVKNSLRIGVFSLSFVVGRLPLSCLMILSSSVIC